MPLDRWCVWERYTAKPVRSSRKRTSRYTFRSTKGISPLNGSLGYSDREMAFFVRSKKQILSPTLASNMATVPTNRAEVNLYGSLGVVRVMRLGENPPIKFTKLFREPLL